MLTAKEKSWEEFGIRMSKTNYNHNLFHEIMKNSIIDETRDKFSIKHRIARILQNESDVMKRWNEYFTELLVEEKIKMKMK